MGFGGISDDAIDLGGRVRDEFVLRRLASSIRELRT
jgi:hypothetical protein